MPVHRHFSTQTLLHTGSFRYRCFYTQTLLHTTLTDAITHRRFYTHTHTCSEPSLRLVKRSVSDMQNTDRFTCQEQIWGPKKSSCSLWLKVGQKCSGQSLWMKRAQITTAIQEWKSVEKGRHAGSWLRRLPWSKRKWNAGTQIGVPTCITRSNGCLRW